MNVSLEPGTYVVAVSGGVDSMVLLDMLRRQPGLRLVVAHLDHGIRGDSAEDRRLVQAYADEHGLSFVYHQAGLGEAASEAAARRARYEFLHNVRQSAGARAVVTAHHADDVLETAVHNLLRGTGRRGLTALRDREHVLRPLLHLSKQDLQRYAQANGLVWREDRTNTDPAYRRNYIRHRLLAGLDPEQRQQLHDHVSRFQALNHEIDSLLINHLHMQPAINRLNRGYFIKLPHAVAREVMAAWLRNNGVSRFDRRRLEQLVTAAKTLRIGKFMSVNATLSLSITPDELALVSRSAASSV